MPDDRPLGRGDLASVRGNPGILPAKSHTADLVVEQSSQTERALYRQADAVLADIVGFQKSVKSETSGERLHKAFDELDRKVHEFLKAAQALGPEQRVLQRSAAYRSARGRTGCTTHVLAGHIGRKGETGAGAVGRLLIAARHLDKTAGYTLGTVQGQGVLVAVAQTRRGSRALQTDLPPAHGPPELRMDFAAVNQALGAGDSGRCRSSKAGENTLRVPAGWTAYTSVSTRLLGIRASAQLIILT